MECVELPYNDKLKEKFYNSSPLSFFRDIALPLLLRTTLLQNEVHEVSHSSLLSDHHLNDIILLSSSSIEPDIEFFITWRLDYCNSVLLEIPLAQIERLQRTQIKAARFIVRTRQREHITPVLRALHRLPVCHRIQIKVRVNVFKCLHGLSPDYLTELVHVHRRDNRLRQPDTFMLSEQVTIRVIRKRVNVRASNAFNQ